MSFPCSSLRKIKEQNFMIFTLFQRIPEYLQFEIFKYLDKYELLEIRAVNLGGYELASKPSLRSKIMNYFPKIRWIFSTEYADNICAQQINLIFEQIGKKELDLEGRSIENKDLFKISTMFILIPQTVELNISKFFYYIYIYI